MGDHIIAFDYVDTLGGGLARLKQLDINGFKSFANPTTFVFDRGITAIIGPNGSGKSNISEALRWVLGEQQYSNLRGRRTEDIIFAGSERRGRLGMAEVTLTLDNSSGVLPIEFSEVSITRRAYRTGENQYLINGNRVRLKDLQQLTAPLGQAHTIVGQGLVDAVLSQRPEDRRGLFEHAAGITGLRLQTASAERGLAEAEENARRLRDIVGELEPRVRSLQRRARQAEQYESVRAELTRLQRAYYANLWAAASERLCQAHAALEAAQRTVDEREREQTEASARLTSLRAAERDLTRERAGYAEKVSALETELAAARHALALVEAEIRAVDERARDQQQAGERLATEQAERRARLEALAAELETLRAELETLTARRDEQAARSEATRRQRDELLARRDELERKIAAARLEQSRLETQLAGHAERRRILCRNHDDIAARRAAIDERIRGLEGEIDGIVRRLAEAEARARETRAERDEAERSLDALERDIRAREGAIRERERELDRLRARLELLDRIWSEGEGLHAGVRAVLRAARGGQIEIPGLIGTVAEAVDVPAQVETAIETALGGHLQDIIVRRWSDAEAAIAFLKRSGAGRARFQPLDTIRSYRPRTLDNGIPGLIDRAVNLVTFDPEVEPVVAQVLGRTLVAEDLDAAHRIARELDGWTIVTLQGELVAPSGSVTGGSRVRGAGLLARERERRELPAKIAAAQAEIDGLREALAARLQRQEQQVARLEQLDASLNEARADERSARERRAARERELAAERNDLERQDRELALVAANLDQLDASADQFSDQQGEIERRLAGLKARLDEAIRGIESLPAQDDGELAALSAELATLQERIRATTRERAALAEQIAAGERAEAERQRETERLAARRADLSARAAAAERSIAGAEARLEEARAGIAPLGERLAGLSAQIAEAESAAEGAAAALREAERAHDRAALDLSRAGDAADLLRARILDDLDLDDPAGLAGEENGAPPDAEEQIRRLRERLRRIGAVGEDVLDEYREESERLEYLTKQLADVEGAAESLRRVLTDLRRQMGARFAETFAEVAKEFEATFKRLFGGGQARLSHEMDGSDPGGIDIVAQPPGKRLQGLNQLSGGERALTAVALLVAIQRVNPSPFCLLDEVDAALDESNVIRFRQELRELAKDTQYIVITHNRGTIEGADTLYGITMGEDSVSRVLSLRLDQAIAAIEDDRLLEMESVI